MSTPLKVVAPIQEIAPTGLALLRTPFLDHHISKLPKETKAQIDARKLPDGRKVMVFNCPVCGGNHHKDAVHLDYVGHAALTDRLLDADPLWTWEPMALNPDGSPAADKNGGMWIKLTVCGVSRIGYGSADGKSGGDAVKEIIGDALRNAAMRFGAALDLWHKGDLHPEPEESASSAEQAAIGILQTYANDPDDFKAIWAQNKDGWKKLLEPDAYARVVAVMKEIGGKLAKAAPVEDDPFRSSSPEGVARGAPNRPRAEDVILDDEVPF